ncbi:tripartite tricarboxylate transporter permease [Candidatus Woesearchaeota archaeon]|nr:tripartite tricarboxylate transporter permease [Candidatus Woesearchaeota archaeon]
MIVELVIAILIGATLGIITGITPGIHINLVAVMLLGLAPFLGNYVNPLIIAVAIVSMSVVHTFLDFIPSCYLGAPDESNVMSALPAHKLLLQGMGFEAVKLATMGSFLGLICVLALLPILIFAVPFIFEKLQDYIGIILVAIMIFMILKEHGLNKKFWSFFVFMISGILGIIVFSLNLEQPLFPMLSGLFGISILVTSISEKVRVPEQRITNELHFSKKEISKSVFAGTISGTIVSIFPGMGPAQAAILGGSLVGKIKDHMYIVLVGAIGTVSMVLSLITLYTINKARNGSIVVVQELLKTVDWSMFLLLAVIAFVAGCVGVFLTMFFARIFSKLIVKVNYAGLCITIIAFVSALVFYFTGVIGLLVLFVSTAIGLIPGFVNIGKNHAMGCLLLPVIFYFIL